MKLLRKKRRDTDRSAGELHQFRTLTGVVPVDIEISETLRIFQRNRSKEVTEILKHCEADAYNQDMFLHRNHAEYAVEAERLASQYDHNLSTVDTIFRIHCGDDYYLDVQDLLLKGDIETGEAEITRLSALLEHNL